MKKKVLGTIFGLTVFLSLGGLVVFALNSEKTKEIGEIVLENIEDKMEKKENSQEIVAENVENKDSQKELVLAENFKPEEKKVEEVKKEEEEKKKIEEVMTENPFKFVVVSDSESYETPTGYENNFEAILSKAKSQNPDFTIFSGDLVVFTNPVDKNRIINLKKLLEKYTKKFYITFGKHDIECGAKCVDVWEESFFGYKKAENEKRALYFSFDKENTHIVLLSSDFPVKHSIDDEQLAWLDKDLADTKRPNKIVVVHVPPVTFFKESVKECHDMSCSDAQRVKLLNLLKKHKVDLVISGHEHVFDHKVVDGIDFVLAGAVGQGKRYKNTTWKDSFLLVNVDKGSIVLKSLDANGGLIREIKVR